VFRLKNEDAIINRLGFNNEGFEVVKERLFKRENNIIGVNIGANKNSKDFINDYITGIKFFSSISILLDYKYFFPKYSLA
jgi:dihydroorotate dehydrogenase